MGEEDSKKAEEKNVVRLYSSYFALLYSTVLAVADYNVCAVLQTRDTFNNLVSLSIYDRTVLIRFGRN
jgi:hypothetical protein